MIDVVGTSAARLQIAPLVVLALEDSSLDTDCVALVGTAVATSLGCSAVGLGVHGATLEHATARDYQPRSCLLLVRSWSMIFD